MNDLIIIYALVITGVLAAMSHSYYKLHKEYLKEQAHSSDLRQTILKYLINRNESTKGELI